MEVCSHWEAPGGTVTIAAWSDGTVTVVSDQGFARGDWQAACTELERLSAAPLGQPDYEGEHDVWTTAVRLPAAA
jgi:hypothetical protein